MSDRCGGSKRQDLTPFMTSFTVFNVGGGGYRVVVAIHFNRQKLYIRHVFTHAEYDRWSARLRSGK